MLDDGKVVGDEQIGQPLLALQIHHQVDDLRLDRHVERGDRLVGDDQLGIERQRAGDRDALPLTAREFVRKGVHLAAPQADLIEQAGDEPLLFLATRDVVHLQRLADDVAGRHARIERGKRVLKDDLHLAAIGPHVVLAEPGHVMPVKPDRAGGRLDQP